MANSYRQRLQATGRNKASELTTTGSGLLISMPGILLAQLCGTAAGLRHEIGPSAEVLVK